MSQTLKQGDKVRIKRPGILNDLIGTITEIKYTVETGGCGAFSLPSEELILVDKDNSTTGLKIANNAKVVTVIDVDKPVKVKKVVSNKPKRAYHKKAK